MQIRGTDAASTELSQAVVNPGPEPRRFVNLPTLSAGPDAFLTALQEADWSAFTPARDLPPLRATLAELERAYDVTEAHRFATGQLRAGGAVLRHPDGHLVEIAAVALSPDGRHLAVGSWCGDDYERGGVLQVWELASGRCVNVLDGIRGGVGWPGYPRTIQWSADGQRIALAYDTNTVGRWDPFGEGVEPFAYASVTDGGSRPPDFALAADGERAYIGVGYYNEDDDAPGCPGCIVPLQQGEVYDDSPDVIWLAETLSDPVKAKLGDEELFFDQEFWSRDGSRIYGHGHGFACSIDVAEGKGSWLIATATGGVTPAWSQDERLFAYQLNGQLVIADAGTGRPAAELPGHPGASELAWGTRGPLARLAVVVPDGNDDGAQPNVVIHDEGQHRYDLAVALMETDRQESDFTAWAWAPDGEHAACLTAAEAIEIWSLGETPERLRVIEAPAGTSGVLWGADGVVVAVGETSLRFIRTATGETTGDFAFLRTPPEPRPLEWDGHDIGEAQAREEEEIDPTFALDDETWAVAFPTGLAIAPPDRRDLLDGVLAWTVDRRFAWPTRWGDLDIVPDAATAAAERVGPPLDRYLESFRGRPWPAPAAEAWPPPNTATLDDLFQVTIESVKPLYKGWDHHVSEGLRHAARLQARRGETAGAERLLTAIPTQAQQVRGCAEVAMILAAAGHADAARTVFDYDEAEIEEVLDEYNVAVVASAVAGVYAALGDTARADAWFDRARAGIEPESNDGENRLTVAWALVECGRVDDARALWREITDTPSIFYSVPFLSYLVRTGRDDLARELLLMRSRAEWELELGLEEWERGGWFDGWEAVEVFVALGRPDLIRVWAEAFGDRYAYEELLAKAETNANIDRRSRPTEADIAALAEAYATLQQTPRAKRERPTELLIQQAAECGHLSAVLDLIPNLPVGDFNGQAGSAFRALWIAATGADVEPW